MSCGVALAGQVRVRVLTALILLAFIACGLCSSTCKCDTPQVRAVLMRFFNATGGPRWRNSSGWASHDPVCSCYGIVCRGADLTDIVLNNNNLDNRVGFTLPAELANITSIQRIDLAGNILYGTLPPEWSSMQKLEELNLGGNRISGSLPPEWGKMRQIRTIRLYGNLLTDQLPYRWMNMAQLKTLSLKNNDLSGPVAPCLFPLWNASFMSDDNFDFSDNEFIGRMRLPCLSIDPCASDKYRKKMNDLLLSGNHFCSNCVKQCPCETWKSSAIDGPNLAILRVSNSSQCCSACGKHPLCVAAVYYYEYGRCELKNVTSPTLPMSNADVLVSL